MMENNTQTDNTNNTNNQQQNAQECYEQLQSITETDTTNNTIEIDEYSPEECVEDVPIHESYHTTGWYSSISIIQSLPDAKIRQAIANYTHTIALLEDELVQRKLHNREIRTYTDPAFIFNTGQRTRRSLQHIRATRRRILGICAKLHLGRSERLKLQNAWLYIIDEYEKEIKNG